MAEFTPINTQEEFDAAIAARLNREREKAVKPYADYQQIKDDLSAANTSLGEKDATIADLNAQLKSARSDLAKTRIALEKHLPLELAERLRGETEDEMRSDADSLSQLFGDRGRGAPEPARKTEPEKSGGKTGRFSTDSLRETLNNLNIGGSE